MDICWTLYGHIPKIGMEKQFREIEQKFLSVTFDASLTEEQRTKLEKALRAELEAISRTPKEFDEKFAKSDGIVDGGRVHRCMMLSPKLRARALIEQTAIEAIDYGTCMMNEVRLIHADGAPIRKLNNDKKFTFERDLHFLRTTASWLMTWGRRGFGYFVLR